MVKISEESNKYMSGKIPEHVSHADAVRLVDENLERLNAGTETRA